MEAPVSQNTFQFLPASWEHFSIYVLLSTVMSWGSYGYSCKIGHVYFCQEPFLHFLPVIIIKKNQLINLQTTQKIPPKHHGPF